MYKASPIILRSIWVLWGGLNEGNEENNSLLSFHTDEAIRLSQVECGHSRLVPETRVL